ncbi:MAG: polysaccharide pyruvyl transferase family protein [Sulfuricella sp.]
MKHDSAAGTPTILFGAFDRHNFGDLLFPHIAAALLTDKTLIFTGLAERDLRSQGGHQVRALAQVAAAWGERPLNVIHVGGEILSCDAWQAAVMLLPPEQAQCIIARLDSHPRERLEWAREQLGISDLAPYALSRQLFPRAAKVLYNAAGGVDLAQRAPALRHEVLAKLKAADAVSVRDELTLAQLSAAGVTASLVPDPAVMVTELFGAKIRLQARQDATAGILDAFPQGYIAVQFSADFGDDATLAEIAAQLDRATLSSGCGVVFFRAGAAPWHDDAACYQRVAMRMRAAAKIFSSLDLWDICALIAHARAYCGSSLHGRIVATAFALPRVSLLHPEQEGTASKQAAYVQTWESADAPQVVGVAGIERGIVEALGQDKPSLAATAKRLSRLYREGFEELRSKLV